MNSASILDNLSEIQKLDKQNMLSSIDLLADQVRHAWDDVQKINFQPRSEIRNVVLIGMGGSGLGADVIKTLFKDQLSVPFDFVHEYTPPAYIDEHSLIILASYSGTTEEVLAAFEVVKKKNAQIMVIAAGGKLAEIAKENNYPIYLINPTHNPCGQPRMAIGYAVFGTIGLLSKAGIITLEDNEVREVIDAIIHTSQKCAREVKSQENMAKTLAFLLVQRRGILVGCEFLEGALHTSANQFNENAKAFVDYKIVPELNHHLLEGLRFPESNALSHLFVFVNSDLYSQRNQKRMILTREAVEKNEIETTAIDLKMTSKITQVFESITIFAYTNFYLAILEGIDPSPIPYVDWFKKQLA